MSNKFEKHEKYILEGGCPAKASEEVRVTVPVTVRAFADCDKVELHCIGGAVITKNCDDTPGRPDKVSKFTVSQKMRVEIPIVFGAECDVGEGHVDFDLDDNDCPKRKCAC